MNKKGRWTLPSQLRYDILHGAFKHERYGVQLIEGHKLIKRASCISFASSFGKVRQTCINKRKGKQKRRGYFQVSSILHERPANTSRRRHRNRHRQRLTNNNTETEVQPVEQYKAPELRYEVLYPSPITSSITHNPKYIDPHYGDSGLSSRRTKQRKGRSKLVNVIQEDLDNLDFDFEDSEEEDPVFYPEPAERETRVSLEDILRQANKAQSLVACCRKRRKSSTECEHKVGHDDKRSVIYVNKDESETETQAQTDLIAEKHVNTMVDPVSVIIPKDDVDEWVLKQKFGSRLLECECFPRKFIIDISEDVSKLHNLKCIESSRADITFACLVFVYDSDNEINNVNEDVYKVYLSMPFSDRINSVRLETLFDYMMTSVDEIILKAIFFVETLPEEVFMKERKQYSLPKSSSSTTLENCAKWESGSYRLDTKHLLKRCFQSKQKLNEAQELGFAVVSQMDAFSTAPLDVCTPTDKFCSVCFESVGGLVPATALISCGHWFCDVCWREHLVTGIREGRTALVCPEYDCDKQVDMGTLVSVIDVNHVIRYLRRCHDTEVEQQSVTKWCPDPTCAGIIKVPSPQVKSVSCQCGRKMCFDCLGEVHWPAPCKAASDYRQKLVENGHDKLLPFEEIKAIEVKGKPCPFCNRFIEKNGGCPYMYCACQKAFCWACEKEWNSVQHGPDCYKHGYSNTYQTTKETIEPDEYLIKIKGRTHEKWYRMALEHRLQQHQVKLQKLKTPMRELRSTLQHYVGRMERRKEPVSFDFDVPDKHYTCEAAKTRDFLNNMAELYSELHRITEHVAIYLQTKQPSADILLPVKHITNRMTALSVFIYDLLQNGSKTDQRHVFNKLKEIRFHARKCITGLLKCINRSEC